MKSKSVFGVLIIIFVALLTYDGALRKWVFPGSEQILLILKDAIILGAFLFAIVFSVPRSSPVVLPKPVGIAFILYILWVIIECFNPSVPNAAVAVWGVKAHLLYASLILLIAISVSNIGKMNGWIVALFPWFVVPPCVIAIFQIYSPPDSFWNQQLPGSIDALAYFGREELVRVSGTFSYITGMAAFLQVATLFGTALVIAGARSPTFLLSLGLVVLCLPATGSRAVIAVVLVGVVMMLAAAAGARLVSAKVAFRALAVSALFAGASSMFMDTAWKALQDRYEENRQEGQGRVITAFTNAFAFTDVAGPTGFGTGTANLGAAALKPKDVPAFSWFPEGLGFEEESGRIVLELGWIGLILSLSLRVSFLLWSIHLLLCGATVTARIAALTALPVMALGVHQGQGVFAAPYVAASYWLCVTLLAMGYAEHIRVQAISRVTALRSMATMPVSHS